MLDFETLKRLSGGAAEIDVACSICGPQAKTPSNRVRKVLRVYNPEPGFSTFCCARCNETGYAHESNRHKPVVVPTKQSNDAEKKSKIDRTPRKNPKSI